MNPGIPTDMFITDQPRDLRISEQGWLTCNVFTMKEVKIIRYASLFLLRALKDAEPPVSSPRGMELDVAMDVE